MRVAAFPLLLLSLLALAGCGQTGTLYFDEAPPADQLPPSSKQASGSLVPVPAAAEKPAPAVAPETPVEAPAATPAEAPADEKTP